MQLLFQGYENCCKESFKSYWFVCAYMNNYYSSDLSVARHTALFSLLFLNNMSTKIDTYIQPNINKTQYNFNFHSNRSAKLGIARNIFYVL